jgi:ribonuclease G
MAEEILVNVTPQETRVVSIENGVLQEVVVERSRNRGLVGNIYLGKVSRVLPGMGAAFLDIGLERTGFLHVSDIADANTNAESNGADVPIEQAVREGQQLLVQVTKDPLGTKGARLSTFLSIPSRYLVLMPQSNTLGISQRIENEDERQRLRDLLMELEPTLKTLENGSASEQRVDESPAPHKQANASGAGGYIARTAAEGATRDEINNDMLFLQRLWQSISARIDAAEVPSNIYEDLPIVFRTLRDLSSAQTEKIRIDSKETHAKVMDFAAQFTPELVSRIEHYPGERPILDLYSTEDEIQRALQRKVDLKSGGHLVIDQTEAMTTIDVNTGAYVGHRTLEETIYKTNLEAAQGIARQLRLRNLGGIIIIDFIDMTDDEHKRQVMLALERALERDHAKTNICEISSLGLIEMTRKRTTESLGHVLCEPCPVCSGRGVLKSAETVCLEVFREIMRSSRQFEASRLLVVASTCVVDKILDDQSTTVAELEEVIGKSIRFQREDQYTQEQFDVVLL